MHKIEISYIFLSYIELVYWKVFKKGKETGGRIDKLRRYSRSVVNYRKLQIMLLYCKLYTIKCDVTVIKIYIWRWFGIIGILLTREAAEKSRTKVLLYGVRLYNKCFMSVTLHRTITRCHGYRVKRWKLALYSS